MNETPSVLLATPSSRYENELIPLIRRTLGCRVHVSRTVSDISEKVTAQSFDVILLDHELCVTEGVDLIQRLRRIDPEVSVMVMTEMEDLDSALHYLKNGAADCASKTVPVRLVDHLTRVVQGKTFRTHGSRARRRLLQNQLEHPEYFADIITADPKLLSLLRYVESVASSTHPVCITGETGTGKDLFASALHLASGRSGSFVVENVSGLDDTLFSDALFGHVRGAFTGASDDHAGLIERAAGGTLFLDEVGDLDVRSQVKLLRVIEHHEYYRLGSDSPRRCDVRFVVASNRDLNALIDDGRFRNDLYYRLATHEIAIPPLRERHGDICLLAHHFVARFAVDSGSRILPLSEECIRSLERYRFPGNVRELQSLMLHAIRTAAGEAIGRQHLLGFCSELDGVLQGGSPMELPESKPVAFGETLPNMQAIADILIDEALRRTSGNQSQAARLIGVTPSAISKRLKRRDESG